MKTDFDLLCEELCDFGTQADEMVQNGLGLETLNESREIYFQIFSKMQKTGTIDSYILSKISLSLMVNYILSQDSQNALQIWSQEDIEENYFARGAYLIENSTSISLWDLMVYFQVSAYLHSSNLVLGTENEKKENMETYLIKCGQYFSQIEYYECILYTIGLWKFLLNKIYNTNGIFTGEYFINKINDGNTQEGINYMSSLVEEINYTEPKFVFLPLDKWEIPAGEIIE